MKSIVKSLCFSDRNIDIQRFGVKLCRYRRRGATDALPIGVVLIAKSGSLNSMSSNIDSWGILKEMVPAPDFYG